MCSGSRAGSSRVKQHTPITQPDHCSEIACACAPHDGLVFVYPLAQVHVVFCTNFQKTVNFQEFVCFSFCGDINAFPRNFHLKVQDQLLTINH